MNSHTHDDKPKIPNPPDKAIEPESLLEVLSLSDATHLSTEEIVSTEEHDDFVKSIGFSLVVHLFVIMIFTVRAIFFEEAPITQSAVQVDLVDLPDKLTNTIPAAAPEPEQSTQPVPEPQQQPENPKTSVTLPPVVKNKVIEKEAINLDSKHKLDLKQDKEKQNQALNKLKQLNAIDALQNEKPKPTANTNPTPHKGNIISAGSAGMSGVGQLMADSYKAQVDQHFRARWALPQYLRNKNFEAQVLVKFDEKGYITSKEIVVSSGNPVFDELVLSTIEKSSPVPTPPARIAQESSVRGYTFRFRE